MNRLMIVSILCFAIVSAPCASAFAGNQEWAVAGKILTGLIGLRALHRAAHHHTPPPPAHVPVQPPPHRGRTWVEPHNTYQHTKVWVPGYWEKVWVEPVYETRTVHRRGRTFEERVLVSEGYWKQVWTDGYFRMERQVVRVPGHWE